MCIRDRTDIPHEFFSDEIERLFSINVAPGSYGVGNVFLPQDPKERDLCITLVEKIINEEGQSLIGWRDVPVDSILANVGDTARESQPQIKQLIIANASNLDQDAFEGILYVIRKNISKIIRTDESISQALMFYVCSLSSRVIIYKGTVSYTHLTLPTKA